MILVQLTGGLGNQMFQYALGRALALNNQTQLLLDETAYAKQTKRAYALDCFVLKPKFATKSQVKDFSWVQDQVPWKYLSLSLQNLMLTPSNKRIIEEPHFHFAPDILDPLKADVWVKGYWNSERYFLEHQAAIRDDFTFVPKIRKKHALLAKQMAEHESVSIHIRRGDYASEKHTQAMHGLISIEHYHQAVAKIKKLLKKPRFYVFSDDLPWVKDNLGLADKETHYVEGNDAAGDLYLMTQCHHNIIANSTFSWWGAWLNQHPAKQVIAPKRWFADTSKNTKDVLPASWIRL